MIKKVLGDKRIILAALGGTVIGNIVATSFDGHPDTGPYLIGLITGLVIALLATVITMEATEKRSKRRE